MVIDGSLDRLVGDFRPAIDQALCDIVDSRYGQTGMVGEAFASCLLAPGKRIRPTITVLTAKVLGGSPEAALMPACAIEMIHAASLIVDDFPCMDDATLRRGRPACHIRYGEDIALLTAFALLNEAYRVIAVAPGIPEKTRLALIGLCTAAVGFEGLIAGQEKDLRGHQNDFDTTHQEKTSALFIAAAKAGALVADMPEDRVASIGRYASHLGLAFQTLDDLVDSFGNAEAAGKDVAQDAGRSNVVSIVGRDQAIARLNAHIQHAVLALEPCGPRTEPLGNLARALMSGVHLNDQQVDAQSSSAL